MTFLAMEKEGEDENLEQNIIRRTLEKKEKTELKWFLSSIMLEKVVLPSNIRQMWKKR